MTSKPRDTRRFQVPQGTLVHVFSETGPARFRAIITKWTNLFLADELVIDPTGSKAPAQGNLYGFYRKGWYLLVDGSKIELVGLR